MNRRATVALAALAALIALGGGIATWRQSTEDPHVQSIRSSPGAASANLASPQSKSQIGSAERATSTNSTPADDSLQTEPGLPVEIARAQSSRPVLHAIERAISTGNTDATDARVALAGFCRPVVLGHLLPNERTAEVFPAIQQYCNGYSDIITDEDASELVRLSNSERSTSGKTRIALREALLAGGKEGARVVIDEILLNSTNAFEIQEALNFAAEGDIVPAALSAIATDSAASQMRSADVLDAASQLEFCRLTSGCGPRTLYSFMACVSWQRCSPNDGLIDQLRWQVAPSDFEIAMQLSAELASARAVRGVSP